ncbi:MAG: cardiolipin synthase [bacterium]|nr:cardiolipin synthase [bacterium]
MMFQTWILPCLVVALSLLAAGHAMLRKRDPKSAMGWVALCLTLPIFGALIYILFGINRIETRARALDGIASNLSGSPLCESAAVVAIADLPAEFSELARVSEAVTGLPLAGGNRIEMLHNGEQAFPAMLEAIEGARHTLYLTTYIFETNTTGYAFVDALERAAGRGVEVRVIIDGFGEWYAWPRIGRVLAKRGIRVERFLEPKLIPPTFRFNLRNHRKILVADGWVGFTGGMNIGDRHLAEDIDNPGRAIDVHFRIEGPVVCQLERVFLHDWAFVSGERREPSAAGGQAAGEAVCRAAVDGPDEDIDKLVTILVGAVSAARHKVAIMNPYFLPPRTLIGALQAAALRGVEVTVVLPASNNLPFVHWASRNMLWELLERGVRVYYQPPPFAHSKLFVVDDHYTQIGSANLDPRSLRLNFELAVEVFDRPFSSLVAAHIESVRRQSREVTVEEVDNRRFFERLRDSLAWLFAPYM